MFNYRQLIHRVKTFFQNHLLILFFLLFFFIIGLIFGSLAIKFIDYQQKKELIEYLSQSILEINQLLSTAEKQIAGRIILSNLKLAFIFWLLSISGIGVVGIPILIFLRGFILGFTSAFLVSELFLRGIGLILLAILPHNLVFIPALILGGVVSLVFVYQVVLKLILGNQIGQGGLLRAVVYYSLFMGGVAVLLLAAGLIETYLTPYLIELATEFLI